MGTKSIQVATGGHNISYAYYYVTRQKTALQHILTKGYYGCRFMIKALDVSPFLTVTQSLPFRPYHSFS